jgi:hypothetical protein
MEARRQRAVTLVLGIAVSGVLAAGLLSRDRLAEEWHIRSLESAREETRNAAADALATLRSKRAVPHLIRGLFEELSPRAASSRAVPATRLGPSSLLVIRSPVDG